MMIMMLMPKVTLNLMIYYHCNGHGLVDSLFCVCLGDEYDDNEDGSGHVGKDDINDDDDQHDGGEGGKHSYSFFLLNSRK
jgi:hypothetical protein